MFKTLVILSTAFLFPFLLFSEGVSGSLPVCYIDTENNQPVDQKTTYINATFYMVSPDSGEILVDPVGLGIRGRGNASWTMRDKKPYKMKFDQKISLFDSPKSKHYALLTIPWGFYAVYGNYFSRWVSGQLGLDWTPDVHPVEVVLNGTYLGLYYLSETVRIESGRLAIAEQPEDNDDPDSLGEGWLVEIDNYTDENQIVLPKDDETFAGDFNNYFTVHTPEPFNDLQKEWITQELNEITAAVHSDSPYDRKWEEKIDLDYIARYFLVQESVHNYDSFVGSTYFYKDKSSDPWRFGPIWDAGDNFIMAKDEWISASAEVSRRRVWIGAVMKYPRFWTKVREVWENTLPLGKTAEIYSLLTSLCTAIYKAQLIDYEMWPENYFSYPSRNEGYYAYTRALGNLKWIDNAVHSSNLTHTLSFDYDDTMGRVCVDGFSYPDFDVFDGDTVEIHFDHSDSVKLSAVYKDGEDVTDRIKDNRLVVDDIDRPMRFNVVFSDILLGLVDAADDFDTNLSGNTLSVSSSLECTLSDSLGRRVWKGRNGKLILSPGVYILTSPQSSKKFVVR